MKIIFTKIAPDLILINNSRITSAISDIFLAILFGFYLFTNNIRFS